MVALAAGGWAFRPTPPAPPAKVGVVRPFERTGGGQSARWQISRDGAIAPLWRADSKELFFKTLTGDGKRFLFALPPPTSFEGPITVILNWASAIQR